MCDDKTLKDGEEHWLASGEFSRRKFIGASSAVIFAAMLPAVAYAADVIEEEVIIETPDGKADCYFVHPAQGQHPAVLIWPDIMGLRPAFRAMGKRLAESGYAVLVVNPFYRSAPAPIAPGMTFLEFRRDAELREKIGSYRKLLTPEANVSDAEAFTSFLDSHPAVDTNRKVGTTGYCMGGSIAFRTAAAIPDRIGAVGSFHGGGLVVDDPQSPHLLIQDTRAGFLIAIAKNDDERDPDARTVLRETFDHAGASAEIEVYNAMHGWCPPDTPAYDEAESERAWKRMLALFEATLV